MWLWVMSQAFEWCGVHDVFFWVLDVYYVQYYFLVLLYSFLVLGSSLDDVCLMLISPILSVSVYVSCLVLLVSHLLS